MSTSPLPDPTGSGGNVSVAQPRVSSSCSIGTLIGTTPFGCLSGSPLGLMPGSGLSENVPESGGQSAAAIAASTSCSARRQSAVRGKLPALAMSTCFTIRTRVSSTAHARNLVTARRLSDCDPCASHRGWASQPLCPRRATGARSVRSRQARYRSSGGVGARRPRR